jgi:hypothetical protein
MIGVSAGMEEAAEAMVELEISCRWKSSLGIFLVMEGLDGFEELGGKFRDRDRIASHSYSDNRVEELQSAAEPESDEHTIADQPLENSRL